MFLGGKAKWKVVVIVCMSLLPLPSGSGSPSNKTLTCAARNIQGPVEFPFLPELLPFVVRCVLILYYMYVCFFGVALNIWTPSLPCVEVQFSP